MYESCTARATSTSTSTLIRAQARPRAGVHDEPMVEQNARTGPCVCFQLNSGRTANSVPVVGVLLYVCSRRSSWIIQCPARFPVPVAPSLVSIVNDPSFFFVIGKKKNHPCCLSRFIERERKKIVKDRGMAGIVIMSTFSRGIIFRWGKAES